MAPITLRTTAVAVAGITAIVNGARASPTNVPTQFMYNTSTVDRSFKHTSGCTVNQWDGMDQNGVAGYPWVTTIDCPEGSSYETKGIAAEGHLRFYLRQGSLSANGKTMDLMGDAYWMNENSYVELLIGSGSFVYIVGSEFALKNDTNTTHRLSSFAADATERYYFGYDAIAGTELAAQAHDAHIGNGTTNARDLVFSKGDSCVDPPSITVLNCAPESDSYVWYHTHPAGAMYIPYTGQICFDTDVSECVSGPAGELRWVSPNLFYKEHFNQIAETNEHAQKLVDLAFAGNEDGDETCEYPVAFGVTNFDPDDTEGQPNFDDAPDGLNHWGVFKTLIVRTTNIVTSTVTLGS